jgi:hypothetical protein
MIGLPGNFSPATEQRRAACLAITGARHKRNVVDP